MRSYEDGMALVLGGTGHIGAAMHGIRANCVAPGLIDGGQSM